MSVLAGFCPRTSQSKGLKLGARMYTAHATSRSRDSNSDLLYMQTVEAEVMNVVSLQPVLVSKQQVPVLAGSAAGGFPNPAADFYEPPISLDELLNIGAPHIWIVRLEGDSMSGAGMYDGSRLVVDRAIQACPGHIVLAHVDNQPVVKRLAKSAEGWHLVSEHPDFKPVTPGQYETIEIFGVVTWCLTPHAG